VSKTVVFTRHNFLQMLAKNVLPLIEICWEKLDLLQDNYLLKKASVHVVSK
jgi:hypothetical protein